MSPACPTTLSDRDAAAVPEAFVTAHDAVFTRAGLLMGETLLVNGANGGVGTAAVQLGVAVGARVLANARVHHDRLAALGAEPVALADAAGVDVVLELIGAQNLTGSLAALAPRGRVIIVGTGAGAETDVSLRMLMGKRASVMGTMLRARPLEEKAAAVQAFAHQVVPLLASGRVRPLVDRVFPAERAVDAFDHLAGAGQVRQGAARVRRAVMRRGVVVRPAGMSDVEAAFAVSEAVAEALHGHADTTVEHLRAAWDYGHAWVALDAGERVVGYATLEDGYVEVWPHPAARDGAVAAALLDAVSRRGGALETIVPGGGRPALVALYRGRGWVQTREVLRMEVDVSDVRRRVRLAAGVRVRTYRDDDAQAVHALLEGAFAGNAEEVPPFARWHPWMTNDPGFDPGVWFLAEAAELLAGVCLCWREGWVKDLAVRSAVSGPRHRRGAAAACAGSVPRPRPGHGRAQGGRRQPDRRGAPVRARRHDASTARYLMFATASEVHGT